MSSCLKEKRSSGKEGKEVTVYLAPLILSVFWPIQKHMAQQCSFYQAPSLQGLPQISLFSFYMLLHFKAFLRLP